MDENNNRIDKIIERYNEHQTGFLDLRDMFLKEIPLQIRGLKNLSNLGLINNELKSLPEWLKEISTLKQIHLSENNFEVFPEILLEMPNLEHICLNSNKLRKIPLEIDKMENLKDFYISRNELIELPCELLYTNITKFSCSGNPFKKAGLESIESFQGVKVLINRMIGDSFVFKLPNFLHIPIKGYLLSFGHFLKEAKNVNILIETRSLGDSNISVDVKMEDAISNEKFINYFIEYLSFAQNAFDKNQISIDFESNLTNPEKEMIQYKVTQNVKILQLQLDQVNFENRYLKQMIDKLIESQNQPVILNLTQQSHLVNSPSFSIEIQNEIIDFKQEFRELIKDLSEVILSEEEVEGSKIINELSDKYPKNKDDINNWKKVKLFLKKCIAKGDKTLDGVSNLSSRFEKVISLYNKLEKMLEKMGISKEEIINNL